MLLVVAEASMSIDTGFDPTRPEEKDARPSSSLKEDPVPHLDESAAETDVEVAFNKVLALDEKFRAAVEKHPMRALGIAALAGFLIGRVASRI
jgi:hypothetical protein